VVLAALVLILVPGAAAAGWAVEPVPPPQTPNGQMSSVACSGSGSTTCTAVGYFISASGVQQTLAARWNGASWAVQSTPNPSGATSSMLSGVSCTAASACTAVGSYATSPGVNPTRVLVEHWNGSSWAIQTTPNPSGASSSQLTGVSCSTSPACTAVGSYLNNAGFQTLAERWNATTWTVQTTTTQSFSGFAGDSCAAAAACTAVGNVFAEAWNGISWTAQPLAAPLGGNLDAVSGVSCTAATGCVLGGGFDRYFQIGFAYSFGSQALVSLPLAERHS
jgi:hypothetical protein